MARLARAARTGTAGTISPGIRRAFQRVIGPFVERWFRPSLAGWEHLPERGPCLLVANHSGGGLADVLCLAWLWMRRWPEGRPITGMTHPAAFHAPGLASLMRGLGAIPSTREAAMGALAAGLPVLAFPGGDHEAFRPFWQASRVDFASRKGFLRLARDARVPIVPIGIRGSSYTLPILWRSRVLALLFLMPWTVGGVRFPITVVGAAGGLFLLAWAGPVLGWAWGALLAFVVAIGPWPLLFPLPARVRIRIGRAIPPEALFDGAEAELERAYERVLGAVSSLVAER